LEKHKIFSNLEVLDIDFIGGERIGKLFNMLSEYENNISVKKLVIDNRNIPLSESSLNSLCKMLMKSKLEKLKLTLGSNWFLIFHLHRSKEFLEAIKNCQIKKISFKLLRLVIHKEDVDYFCSIIDSVKEAKNIEYFKIVYKENSEKQRIIKKLTELAESRRNFGSFKFSVEIDAYDDNEIDNFLNTLSSLTCLTKFNLKINFDVNENRIRALEKLVKNNKNLKVLKLKNLSLTDYNLSFKKVMMEIALHDSLKKVHINSCLNVNLRMICEIIGVNRSIEELKAYINLEEEIDNFFYNIPEIEFALRRNHKITKLDLYDYTRTVKITSDDIEMELKNNLELKC
jgi:hypothetical protein